jgi:hypothetical protein
MKTFENWVFEQLNESASSSRYSVEVNYRTNSDEAMEAFAKIALGYVSATLKGNDYHVKQVFDERPIRIIVASRNFDDGEWVGIASWNNNQNCFIASKGFYNKDRKTGSGQGSKKCSGKSASEIAKELLNHMHSLKGQPNRHKEKLKPVPLKRGPKS